jgi:hypothetical protein
MTPYVLKTEDAKWWRRNDEKEIVLIGGFTCEGSEFHNAASLYVYCTKY